MHLVERIPSRCHTCLQGKSVRDAAVIHANPDQSKHLETARMKLAGDVWLDLVNLRSETYASDSRIPTMEFGTPLQDALRRDFTINAMFYNINQVCSECVLKKNKLCTQNTCGV
jgi:tRNA nucleotidyltransferase/poly(A) polymerase